MGIADVKEKYPGADKVLNGVIKGPVEGTQRYSVVNNVEDMRVELRFGFLEGRLNKVVVASMILEDVVRDSLARRPWPSDKEKEEREKNAWYWRKRVYDVLIAKYGPPLQAPDAPTLRRFCDRVPGGCVYGSEAATALQWTWRSGETIIVLHGGAAPELSYVDARVEQKVEEMLKVQSDGWRKTQEDQKAADRSRL